MLLKRMVRSEKMSDIRRRLMTAVTAMAGELKSMFRTWGMVNKAALTPTATGTDFFCRSCCTTPLQSISSKAPWKTKPPNMSKTIPVLILSKMPLLIPKIILVVDKSKKNMQKVPKK